MFNFISNSGLHQPSNVQNKIHFCPHCNSPKFIKKGFFIIRRTRQKVRKFHCKHCLKHFSNRTLKLDYRHKKMDLNHALAKLLTEGNSLRACARILGMTYKNTYLKFLWFKKVTNFYRPRISVHAKSLQFDDLETILHTKCKPLSIALVVTNDHQLISAQVAEIPAKGRLAKFSVSKYGKRKDERFEKLQLALAEAKSRLKNPIETIESDAHPIYGQAVRSIFGETPHLVFKRKIDRRKLQERLHEKHQKRKFDPLFPVNHQCARLRDRIKRLTRRSWCTTKKLENLQLHLDLVIHMEHLGWS